MLASMMRFLDIRSPGLLVFGGQLAIR
jgi:hypothetical protein